MLDDEIVLVIQFIDSKNGSRSPAFKLTQQQIKDFIVEHFNDEQKEEQLILLLMTSNDKEFPQNPLITCNQFLGVLKNG